MRGFKVDGKTDQAVALMKQTKVYSLAKAQARLRWSSSTVWQGDQHVAPDTFAFFEMLAQLVNDEPADIFTPLERFYMQAIGIEKGKPFQPRAERQGAAR